MKYAIQKLCAQNNDWTKKKLIYSKETPRFSNYYIGWIGICNCDQKTSTMYVYEMTLVLTVCSCIPVFR